MKNYIFNCQILHHGGTPSYNIHCIRPPSKSAIKCKLKIKYMIIGNYADFNSINYDILNSNIQLEVIKKDYDNNKPKCVLY